MCPDNVNLYFEYVEYVALKIQIHWFLRYWRNFTETKQIINPCYLLLVWLRKVMINPLII